MEIHLVADTDYYEACFLKDKIRENLKGYMMSDDNPFKIKNSKLIRENAKKALEREKNRNSGTLCTAFFFSTI